MKFIANQQLIIYIEKHLKKGVHADRIKSKLLEVGHDVENVEDALAHVHFKNNVTKITVTAAMLVLMVALIVIEATTPEETEVINPNIEMFSPPVVEEEPVYDFGGYTDLVNAAVENKDALLCDEIYNEEIKVKCKEMVK